MGTAQQSRAGDLDPPYVTGAGTYGPRLGHGEAPEEHRTISSVYIKQQCQPRAKQCTQRLSTWKLG